MFCEILIILSTWLSIFILIERPKKCLRTTSLCGWANQNQEIDYIFAPSIFFSKNNDQILPFEPKLASQYFASQFSKFWLTQPHILIVHKQYSGRSIEMKMLSQVLKIFKISQNMIKR